MFDIITFGSATWDIFLKPKNFQLIKNKKFITQRGICFNFGSKIDVEKIIFSSGGGGTNTATTFSKQGFKTAYCGMVGNDLAGQVIIKELKKLGIDTRFIYKTNSAPTNLSVILNIPEKDRTIFVYRGASELLEKKDIPWGKLQAKWFYLAPLSGKLCRLFEPLTNFAYRNKIKIVINPGNTQLSLEKNTLRRILQKVDILILNQEEASLLTKIPYREEEKIFKKIDSICPGISIMTKGPKGAVVSDGKYLYQVKAPRIKVADRTGGGDAGASGFVSGFIESGGNIESAIQLGIANASVCLQKWGAKNGLLKKGEKLTKVKIIKEKL